MRNKRILITGAAGSIGSEICRQLYKTNKLYGLDFNEMGLHAIKRQTGINVRVGDIRNRETLRNVFDDFRPQIVFHTAAYKSVDMMEYTSSECTANNIIGTENVLDYSKIYPVEKFVFISTDKAVNPHSIMGTSKLYGERITVNSGKGYVAVRFGNVLGSRGSLMSIWEDQINEGNPITITDPNMMRYFMTIPQAVNLVLTAAEIGKGGEVICFEMGKPVSILSIAQEIIEKLGRDIPIEIIGNRGGEAIEEKLMTEEEKRTAIKHGKFYIIK